MIPKRSANALELFAATVVVAFAMALVFFPFPNPDLYWLLATGRRMLETRAFIYHDPFTFTVAGSPWSPQSWLTAVLYFVLFQAGGMAALTALRLALVGAIVALTLRSLRIVGASWAMSSPLVVLGVLVAHTRLTDRGQLFEYALLAWFVAFLLQSHDRRGGSFFVLPVAAQLLWVQLHSSFLLGPVLTAIFFLCEWVATRVPFLRPLHPRDFRRSFALVGALALACLVNPNPRAFLIQPFDPAQRALLSRFTLEWKSPFDAAIASGNFHPYYEILLALAALAILFNLRKLPCAPATLLVATALLSFQSHRFRVEFALVAVPMIVLLVNMAPPVDAFLRSLAKRKRLARATQIASASGVVVALGLIAIERGRLTEARTADPRRPDRAVAFVLENGIARRPFNTIAFGSYMLWDAYGERRTFIDGRNFSAPLYRDFLLAQASDDGWRAAIVKYQLDSFIVPAWSVADAGIRNVHQRLVRNRAAWDLVHIDEHAFVYVAKASADSAWLDAHAFRVYHPATFEGARLARGDVVRAVAELERATAEAPADPLLWLHLGAAYEADGDLMKALAALERAAALEPENARVWDQMARVATAAGKLDQALEAAEQVIRLVPANAGVYVNLARIYEAKGDVTQALRACHRALTIDPGIGKRPRCGID